VTGSLTKATKLRNSETKLSLLAMRWRTAPTSLEVTTSTASEEAKQSRARFN
jgi:hypothetical protein